MHLKRLCSRADLPQQQLRTFCQALVTWDVHEDICNRKNSATRSFGKSEAAYLRFGDKVAGNVLLDFSPVAPHELPAGLECLQVGPGLFGMLAVRAFCSTACCFERCHGIGRRYLPLMLSWISYGFARASVDVHCGSRLSVSFKEGQSHANLLRRFTRGQAVSGSLQIQVVICSFAFIMVPCRSAAVDVFALGPRLWFLVLASPALRALSDASFLGLREEVRPRTLESTSIRILHNASATRM